MSAHHEAGLAALTSHAHTVLARDSRPPEQVTVQVVRGWGHKARVQTQQGTTAITVTKRYLQTWASSARQQWDLTIRLISQETEDRADRLTAAILLVVGMGLIFFSVFHSQAAAIPRIGFHLAQLTPRTVMTVGIVLLVASLVLNSYTDWRARLRDRDHAATLGYSEPAPRFRSLGQAPRVLIRATAAIAVAVIMWAITPMLLALPVAIVFQSPDIAAFIDPSTMQPFAWFVAIVAAYSTDQRLGRLLPLTAKTPTDSTVSTS